MQQSEPGKSKVQVVFNFSETGVGFVDDAEEGPPSYRSTDSEGPADLWRNWRPDPEPVRERTHRNSGTDIDDSTQPRPSPAGYWRQEGGPGGSAGLQQLFFFRFPSSHNSMMTVAHGQNGSDDSLFITTRSGSGQ